MAQDGVEPGGSVLELRAVGCVWNRHAPTSGDSLLEGIRSLQERAILIPHHDEGRALDLIEPRDHARSVQWKKLKDAGSEYYDALRAALPPE